MIVELAYGAVAFVWLCLAVRNVYKEPFVLPLLPCRTSIIPD